MPRNANGLSAVRFFAPTADMRNVAACCGDNMFCALAANGISAQDKATAHAVSARPIEVSCMARLA
ncbi:hypothetical protein PPGU16_29320 [Paraburkholderia largidicola]|uniref:Uncharacterized protein n=1 Tax=Paraburkholderia largidicola TaxID=3014751 RepID=A0A7I8BN32_9BURK|nr:hypothetical protein PPGU16_29320 [Paraburkholderia sp. PGU16]